MQNFDKYISIFGSHSLTKFLNLNNNTFLFYDAKSEIFAGNTSLIATILTIIATILAFDIGGGLRLERPLIFSNSGILRDFTTFSK